MSWWTVFIAAIAVIGVILALARDNGPLARLRARPKLDSRDVVSDAIVHLHQRQHSGRLASIESLAGAVTLTPGQAAELVGKLEERGLVETLSNGLKLTSEGYSMAVQVVRTHRLLERFLADETSLALTDVHRYARRVHNSMSDDDIARLDADMGHPRFDPHGDPIPTAGGDIEELDGISLVEAEVDSYVRIVHIEDEPPELFAQIAALDLAPGMVLTIIERTPTRVVFECNDREMTLAPIVASNITVVTSDAPVAAPPKMPLSALTVGQTARVAGLGDACRGLTRRRFLDLGITPGVEVEALLRGSFGDPTAYRVRGTTIALRREQADLIFIEAEGHDNDDR